MSRHHPRRSTRTRLLAGAALLAAGNPALAEDDSAVCGVLQLHAELADVLGRLDEGAADVVVADDTQLVGNP